MLLDVPLQAFDFDNSNPSLPSYITHKTLAPKMPVATIPTITTDQIDDLLYLARIGETTDLKAAVDLFAKSLSTTPGIILTGAVDKDSGNGLLHMAAANGHTGLFPQAVGVL